MKPNLCESSWGVMQLGRIEFLKIVQKRILRHFWTTPSLTWRTHCRLLGRWRSPSCVFVFSFAWLNRFSSRPVCQEGWGLCVFLAVNDFGDDKSTFSSNLESQKIASAEAARSSPSLLAHTPRVSSTLCCTHCGKWMVFEQSSFLHSPLYTVVYHLHFTSNPSFSVWEEGS